MKQCSKKSMASAATMESNAREFSLPEIGTFGGLFDPKPFEPATPAVTSNHDGDSSYCCPPGESCDCCYDEWYHDG